MVSLLLMKHNWLLWLSPLKNQKRFRSIICTQSACIWWKTENWSGRSWDNWALRNH